MSEKPRLQQIPSAEDLETDGRGVGQVVDDVLEHRESSHGQPEARGPVPLPQHQQVWLCPDCLSESNRSPGAWPKMAREVERQLWESEIQVSVGLVPSRGCEGESVLGLSPWLADCGLPVHQSVFKYFSFYKNNSSIVLGPILITSF